MTTPSISTPHIGAPADEASDAVHGPAEQNAPIKNRSAYVVALDSVVSRLEAIEDRQQRLEVERVAALADAFDVLAAETGTAYGSVPTGKSGEIAYRALRAEIAMVTGVTEPSAERQLNQAQALRHSFARTGEAFVSGEISYRHTTVIVDAAAVIGGSDAHDAVEWRAGYQEAILTIAHDTTPNRLQPIARRLAEQFAERSLDERHAEARQRRHVRLVEHHDGMADLIAHLPAVEAHGVYDRLTRISKRIGQDEARQAPANRQLRTRDQIRADVLTELAAKGQPAHDSADTISGDPATDDVEGIYAGPNRITAQVQVVVPVEALGALPGQILLNKPPPGSGLGGHGLRGYGLRGPRLRDPGVPRSAHPPEQIARSFGAPALLADYGPIDAWSATRLAAKATHWDVAYIERTSGVVLGVDRYRPSKAMRRYLEVRDQNCRFPGCRVPASRCEMDHTIDAALGGPTVTTNLEALCKAHHAIKHGSDWKVEQLHDGILKWTSPTGRTRVEHPARGATDNPTPSDEEHPF